MSDNYSPRQINQVLDHALDPNALGARPRTSRDPATGRSRGAAPGSNGRASHSVNEAPGDARGADDGVIPSTQEDVLFSGPPVLTAVAQDAPLRTSSTPGARVRENRTARVSLAERQELYFPQHEIGMSMAEGLARLGNTLLLRCWRSVRCPGYISQSPTFALGPRSK